MTDRRRKDYVGEAYGPFTVLEELPESKKRKSGRPIRRVRIQCRCGKISTRRVEGLYEALSQSGCQSCRDCSGGCPPRTRTNRSPSMTQARISRGLTLKGLGKKAGVNTHFVAMLEQKNHRYLRRHLTQKSLRGISTKIAEFLEIEIWDVLDPRLLVEDLKDEPLPEIAAIHWWNGFRSRVGQDDQEIFDFYEVDPEIFREEFSRLDSRSQELLSRRFFHEETLESIGSAEGVTHERARQLINDALEVLKIRLIERRHSHTKSWWQIQGSPKGSV